LTFEKFTTKLNITGYYPKDMLFKANNYRYYNQAYYEEILIDCRTEARVALNYRERFLIKKEEILLVLDMYAKNDYVSHFLKIDKSEINHKEYIELFMQCIKSDSYKIGLHIYLKELNS
jgi:hypothetical protein